MSLYNLSDEQAHQALTGKLVLVEPLSKQPPEGYSFLETLVTVRDTYMWFIGESEIYPSKWMIKLPHPIGSTVWLKNKNKLISKDWKVIEVRVCRVQEIAWGDIIKTGFRSNVEDWCPVIQFPETYSLFKDWFNNRYSHPRPRMKSGKLIGYKCWCWDKRSFLNYISTKRRHRHYHCSYIPDTDGIDWLGEHSHGWLYKGKPLTIWINPFVTITMIERGKHD